MLITEFTIENEFPREKSDEFEEFIKNNVDRIKGIGIEAKSYDVSRLVDIVVCLREVDEIIHEYRSNIEALVFSVINKEPESNIFKIVIKLFDEEPKVSNPLIS